MPNEENMVAPEEKVQEASEQDTSQQAPQDLSEAFKVLRANEQAAAPSSVEPAEQPIPEPEPQQEEQAYDPGDVQQDTGDALGGFATELQGVDYGTYAQGIDDQLKTQAMQLAANDFKNANIQRYEPKMLYRRDETTGEVTFINPEKPSRPFETREEAQRWCDSINKDIKNEFENLARNYYQQLYEQSQPALRTLAFAPKYEQMSELERSIFDDMIEGYEVYNADGEVIGYNVDLDAAAARAQAFAKKYGGTQQTQQVAPQQSGGPAVDMKSSSSSAQGKEDVKEPTNLEEAMKMLNSSRKGK